MQSIIGGIWHLPTLGNPVTRNPDNFFAAYKYRQAVAQRNRRFGVGKNILNFF